MKCADSMQPAADKWEIPRYSEQQINDAGNVMRDGNSALKARQDALQIVNNWRFSHAHPLKEITDSLIRDNKDATVERRLKRLESIVEKLKRFPDTRLYQMDDLGACRVIADSVWDVYDAVIRYKDVCTAHVLVSEDDYIRYPKASGYRAYHMVYQYRGEKKGVCDDHMLIEIQFRTKLQHIWATAVETMGICTKSKTKTGENADAEVLRFFVLLSSVFARMESVPICPGTPDHYEQLIDEIKEIDERLNILSGLEARSVSENYAGTAEFVKLMRKILA